MKLTNGTPLHELLHALARDIQVDDVIASSKLSVEQADAIDSLQTAALRAARYIAWLEHFIMVDYPPEAERPLLIAMRDSFDQYLREAPRG